MVSCYSKAHYNSPLNESNTMCRAHCVAFLFIWFLPSQQGTYQSYKQLTVTISSLYFMNQVTLFSLSQKDW